MTETGARPRATTVFAVWTLVALFFLSRTYLISLFARGTPLQWLDAFAALADSYLWALFTFPILALARRFPIRRGRVLRSLPVHAVAALLAATCAVLFNWSVANLIWDGDVVSIPRFFAVAFHWGFQWYWVIVGVSHLIGYHRAIRDRDLQTAQLETRLARAQLDALKMQIRPHFLFNTLHMISEVMHRDVDAADGMMAQLGHMLRLSFERSDAQGIPLGREVEFLQPLVENAVQHGLAPRAGLGRILVRATREGERLVLEVEDDGVGMAREAGRRGSGVGISNTCARLRQIYGDDHRFTLSPLEGGGTAVRIDIPYREAPEEAAGRGSGMLAGASAETWS